MTPSENDTGTIRGLLGDLANIRGSRDATA